MSRAAALLLLAMICGIASYQWRIGAGSNPASIQPKMRDNMTEAHAEIILTNGRIYTGDPEASLGELGGNSWRIDRRRSRV
jgi:hypothetical protein